MVKLNDSKITVDYKIWRINQHPKVRKGQIMDAPIASNHLQGFPYQHAKFHASITKGTIFSHICCTIPKYRLYTGSTLGTDMKICLITYVVLYFSYHIMYKLYCADPGVTPVAYGQLEQMQMQLMVWLDQMQMQLMVGQIRCRCSIWLVRLDVDVA